VGTKSSRKRLRHLCEAFVTAALRLPEWRKYEAIKALPEFEAVYAFAEGEGLIAKIGVEKSDADGKPLPPDAADLWQLYLLPLTERCSKSKLADVYPLLEESLYADHATWHVLASLPGFMTEAAPVQLPNGVSIRELTASEKRRLQRLERALRSGRMLALGLQGVTFAMSCRKQFPKAWPTEAADEDFDTVATALRLLKDGTMWCDVRVKKLEYPPFGTHFAPGTVIASWPANPVFYFAPEYELLRRDVEPLKELVASLERISEHRQLQVAVGRFKLAYERRRSEDTLVDLWIGLEALFLPDEPPQELRYRASLRVAYFLGEGAGEREGTFRKIRNSYDVRSAIVHGRQAKDVGEIAQFTEDVLRRALARAVVTPESLNINQLDKLIVRGI
jgi:hypothetical protein